MANAVLKLPSGATVTITGTPAEISQLLAAYSNEAANPRAHRARKTAAKQRDARKSSGPTAVIKELRDEGYFKLRRSLVDVQEKLEERGHIYAQKAVAQLLVQLVRRRQIRRLKGDKKVWEYVA